MSNEHPTESSNSSEPQQEEKEIVQDDVDQKLNATQTVSDPSDVQSFCAEFLIKVENAGSIRPWLQFSDTNFPGRFTLKMI